MWFFFLFFLASCSLGVGGLTPILATDYNSSSNTTITATIGENRVTIYGYTSPNSKVELSNSEVFDITYSDDTGYFSFDKILLPKVEIPDLCLTSFDNDSRSTTPTCFPAPPLTNYHTDIGPILLPPTITLEESNINPNSTVFTSGQSIPNSQVSLSFYKVNDSAQAFSLFPDLIAFIKPHPALAYSLPSVTATTDNVGNFSLNLPTAYASNYRLYATTKFDNNYSPKSNTLIYILPSLFYLFLQQHHYLILLVPSILLALIILFFFLSRKKTKQSKFLPTIRRFFPAITVCKIKNR
jgi:hypothetical protein